MAAPEEGAEPLRYQTLALKVRIHCEGCKKKVKKVLHSMEGVYKTDIDAQQQKVVVIGNVSADALIKKLLKTGKHAEPWPEPAAPAPDGSPGGGGGGAKKKKKKSKNAANSQPAEPADGGGGPSPPDNVGACDEGPDGEHDKPEGGGGGGQPGGAGDAHDGGAGKFAPVAMTPHGPPPVGNGNGGGGKKKGKKGGHGNANANGDTGATVEVHAPTNPVPVVGAGPHPPPPPMSYPGYYGDAGVHSPAYVMSYNTANPSPALRSSTSYYHPMVRAAYTTGGGGYFYSPAPGSYYMFSEENANACSVM